MRRASYPTYAQSAAQPYGNDEFRSSERAYRSATESSMPGTSVRAGAGASISSILGTSEPQAIGNFMRANNLTTGRVKAGGTYFVPSSAESYGDQQALQKQGQVFHYDKVEGGKLGPSLATKQLASQKLSRCSLITIKKPPISEN